MTAAIACEAIEAGILRAMPEASCIRSPMADGGEGTMEILKDALGAATFKRWVTGPLGNSVQAAYALSADGSTGILELASASGLALVPPQQRDPLRTTTYGTGELIKEMAGRGISRLIIGIGGSATNDGGMGMMQALGVRFLDMRGKELGFGGGELSRLVNIDLSGLPDLYRGIQIEVACDVENPLCGPQGASLVYGGQKGASPETAAQLDSNLQHYASILHKCLGKDISDVPGVGAAGGTGAALLGFLKADLRKGIELVIAWTGLEENIKKADYIFTGEGSIDAQTLQGKTISGILNLARLYSTPVIAFAGRVQEIQLLYQAGLTAAISIIPAAMSMEQALTTGPENLERAAESITRVLAVRIR